MKMSFAVAKIYRYMQEYRELYSEVEDLIAIVSDPPKKLIKIYIAGQLHNLLTESSFNDGSTLISVAGETIRAATLVKRIKLAGK